MVSTRALTLCALAMLSCGGRSGLLGLEESNSGGASAVNGGTNAVSSGGATGGSASTSGGATAASGAAMGGALTVGGANSSGGESPLGVWVTLNHAEPPVPSENAFDFVGFRTAFTDVWSDDSRRALVATSTPGYKAPSSGGLLRFEGGTMAAFSVETGRLYSPPRLAGLSLSDLWLTKDYAGLVHSDGTTTTFHAQPQARLIWENAANDVWACSVFPSAEAPVGYQLSHWDGSVWTQMPLPEVAGFVPRGLWGRSASDMYVVGTSGTLLHWNGATFEARTCIAGQAWNAVWGEPDAIWMVGDFGAVARWQGDSCARLPTRSLLRGGFAFSDIWGSGPDNVWIVGAQGSILHWNGSALEVEPSHVKDDLNAVWGNPSGVVWVVGNNETVIRRAF